VARIKELEAERDAAQADANMQSRERDACNQWLDEAIIATGRTCEKWSLAEAVSAIRAERDAARAEVQYLLKLSSKYAADLQAFCCNPRAALSAHLNSTENTNG
jgi:uncharacterized coiled-coil DUF342 family protein